MKNPEVQTVLVRLQDGPKSCRELGISTEFARQLEKEGLCLVDPDRFPGEYVPFNPLVVRLPGDERPWPGWLSWNL